MNKQQLAAKIWESANKMRSKIEASEYKDYILGFMFYKYLSDKEIEFLKDNDFSDQDIQGADENNEIVLKYVQNNLGYFIAYEHLFSTWLQLGNHFDVSNVRDALSAFSRLINPTHAKVFGRIFDTLQTGLSKLGDSSGSQTRAISGLLQLIKDIPMNGRQDYDVLGFIYEYLIGMFAANAGQKAGEFYTPHEVSLLMSEIVAHHLRHREEISIYDPTSGSGSLLINIGRSVSKYIRGTDKIKYYAQELKENTYNLTRMNLVMRGINAANIATRNADTLEDDWPYFDENDPVNTYSPLYVDAVVSNPPYSQHWDPTNKGIDPRYARFGLAPKGKADYAFVLHDLFHLKPDGIMTIVLPHGVLFRGGEEGQIRKNLIEQNHIDAIIGLPANIFFGTGIPTIIMVLKQKRDNTDVLIVDASKGFSKRGKSNALRACDIKKIVDAVARRESIDKYSRVIQREEIRANEYNLNIPRYVDSSEKAESWDIYASMFGGVPAGEVDELSAYWTAFPGLKPALFSGCGEAYLNFRASDSKATIQAHEDIKSFKERFNAEFGDFDAFLRHELIEKMAEVQVSTEENVLSNEVFRRLSKIPLVDPHEAYEILDENYRRIAIDLEMIQTEGFGALKKVDPNMVLKKKDNKEIEIQEGWIGHILPFSLIQEKLLAGELAALREKENRITEIAAAYDELFEELPEEEKEKTFVNDDKTDFVPAEVKKEIKAGDVEPEVLAILKRYDALNAEEKALKKKIKDQAATLQIKTKATIEALSDEQAREFLAEKWIRPVMDGISELPNKIVSEFIRKLEALKKKYDSTLDDVEQEIQSTEKSLSDMLGQLTGSEYDMRGLAELKKLLGGDLDD